MMLWKQCLLSTMNIYIYIYEFTENVSSCIGPAHEQRREKSQHKEGKVNI